MAQKSAHNHHISKISESRKQLPPLMFEMGRLIKSEIAHSGSSIPTFLHLETLRFIEEQKTPTMREIADYLKIAPPTATSLVNTFVKEGMLTRVDDDTDRRRVRLTLSPKGIRVFEEAMKDREQAFAKVTASLSDEDCLELTRILTIITRTT